MHSHASTTLRHCRRCDHVKPLSDFSPRSSTDPRPRSYCKACSMAPMTVRRAATNYNWTTRARSLQVRGATITAALLRAALGEPMSCYLCGSELTWDAAQIDHVVPIIRGGTHEVTNLRWACTRCNRAKGTMTVDELVALAASIVAHQARPMPATAPDRMHRNRGEGNHTARLTRADVVTIMDRHQAGIQAAALAAVYGVDRHTISDILRGKTWGWFTGRRPLA